MINAWNGLSSGRNGVVGGNHENFLKNRQKVLVNKIFFVHLQTQTKHGSLGSLAQLVQNETRVARELSSVGSERLPYKQRVGGSTPSAPTKRSSYRDVAAFFVSGFAAEMHL